MARTPDLGYPACGSRPIRYCQPLERTKHEMCGIAGIFDYRGPGKIDRALLRRMTDILGHRGPDGDGFHFAPGLGLGHRRLAIVDLVTGDQPLFNEDGTVCVVYNGDIYNFQPLMP